MNTGVVVAAVVLVAFMGVLAFFAERGGQDMDESEEKEEKKN